MLKELKADILCFQGALWFFCSIASKNLLIIEMKISRQLLTKPFAVPEGYDAVMSFPKNKGGYSGVAVYTDSAKVVALKAEEGLTGGHQATSKVVLDAKQQVSSTYPEATTVSLECPRLKPHNT
jgi:AP endonuclease-2